MQGLAWRDIFVIVIIAWAGAAVISLLVYEARENDLEGLRERLSDVQDQIDFNGQALAFEPASGETSDTRVTILSTSTGAESIPGVIDAAGSMTVSVANIGVGDTLDTYALPVSATASDGAACETTRGPEPGYPTAIDPGQYTEVTVLWSCQEMVSVEVGGVVFQRKVE
jgi:hypothetical protein